MGLFKVLSSRLEVFLWEESVFSGQIFLWSDFLCEWPRKQRKEEILFLKRMGILRMEQGTGPDEGWKVSPVVIVDQDTCSKRSTQSRHSA